MRIFKERYRRYLYLWDAFQIPGCPICNLVSKYHGQMANEVFEESVFVEKTGVKKEPVPVLCSSHTWELWKRCPNKAGAVFDETLSRLATRIRRAVTEHGQYGRATKTLGFLKILQRQVITTYVSSGKTEDCVICDAVIRYERRLLKVLLDFMGEFDFAQSYRHSDGLCSLHFNETLNNFLSHRHIPLLMNEQLVKIGMIKQQIEDHKKKGEIKIASEKEDNVLWNAVLEFLAGKNEIVSLEGLRGKNKNGKKQPEPTLHNFEQEEGKEESPERVFEDILFEHEKLRRQYDLLKKKYQDESSRAAALNYRCWKLNEANKNLEMNYVGARAMANGHKEQIDYLNRKIARLEEALGNKEQVGE